MAEQSDGSAEKAGSQAAEDCVAVWLYGGQFHCDDHRAGIPFVFAPLDAVCAECSGNAPESYLRRGER